VSFVSPTVNSVHIFFSISIIKKRTFESTSRTSRPAAGWYYALLLDADHQTLSRAPVIVRPEKRFSSHCGNRSFRLTLPRVGCRNLSFLGVTSFLSPFPDPLLGCPLFPLLILSRPGVFASHIVLNNLPPHAFSSSARGFLPARAPSPPFVFRFCFTRNFGGSPNTWTCLPLEESSKSLAARIPASRVGASNPSCPPPLWLLSFSGCQCLTLESVYIIFSALFLLEATSVSDQTPPQFSSSQNEKYPAQSTRFFFFHSPRPRFFPSFSSPEECATANRQHTLSSHSSFPKKHALFPARWQAPATPQSPCPVPYSTLGPFHPPFFSSPPTTGAGPISPYDLPSGFAFGPPPYFFIFFLCHTRLFPVRTRPSFTPMDSPTRRRVGSGSPPLAGRTRLLFLKSI